MLRMRFGSFVWPNNPRTYTISCKRQTAVHKVPMGGFVVQDLGRTATVMKGEGEFFGADAYSTFLELLAVFQKGGRGTLVHPVWQTAGAYLTELELTQEPRDDYVAYRFTFFAGFEMAFLSHGSAFSKNSSDESFFIYSAFIQRSFSMSNTAGDLEMPEISKISASSERVKNSRSAFSPFGLQPRSAT